MEVAEQIVVVNKGRIEQSGSASDLYERPANPFVMTFVGEVNRLGGSFVRPHDIDILADPAEGATRAMIERLVWLGFTVRVEFVLEDGDPLSVQVTRQQAEEQELEEGSILWVRPARETEFAA